MRAIGKKTDERTLQLLARRMLSRLDERNAVLDIFLLPHAEIKALKARFIKKQTEPNVLAFPEPQSFPHPELGARAKKGAAKKVSAKKYLGEIYLNKDILGRSPERTAPLLVHGVLHLLGYDHMKKADAAKMEKLEAEVLMKI
jgi:probable rRNA maturation factor